MSLSRSAKDPSYQDYVKTKKQKGEKPLSKDQWEVKVLGKDTDESETEYPDLDHAAVESKLQGLFRKVKGVSSGMLDAVKKAPAEVGKLIVDQEHRAKALTGIASGLRKAPEKTIKKILSSTKSELHEIKHAGKATVKLLKQGPKALDKKDLSAMYATGGYVAGALLAAVPPGGLLMASGAIGKAFALHVGLKAVNHALDNLAVHAENLHAGQHIVHHLMHVFASKDPDVRMLARRVLAADAKEDEDEMQEALIAYIMAHTAKQLEDGITDEDMEQILQEKKPERKEPKPDKKDKEPKKASLRSQTIRLAHANPSLRPYLLPLLQGTER